MNIVKHPVPSAATIIGGAVLPHITALRLAYRQVLDLHYGRIVPVPNSTLEKK